MLDIETLSTRPHASILSISAIRFEMDSLDVPFDKIPDKDKFNVYVSTRSCKKLGLHECEKTKRWWSHQDPKIRKRVMGGVTPIGEAIEMFRKWIGKDYREINVWGNGASFDPVIIDEVCTRLGVKKLWSFRNIRDCRTAYDIGEVWLNDFKGDKQHDSLYDCYYQINALRQAFRNIQ